MVSHVAAELQNDQPALFLFVALQSIAYATVFTRRSQYTHRQSQSHHPRCTSPSLEPLHSQSQGNDEMVSSQSLQEGGASALPGAAHR